VKNLQQQKKWTILIYANGNNELQPEIWQSKIAAENTGSHQNVNVVLQISREKDTLVSILRPSISFPSRVAKWIGTRRYLIDNGKSTLLKDLGKINMSSPATLYEFTKWAIPLYPAQNYMLILSGHGYQFVGAITDYSQHAPFIMGISEMCTAIERACSELNCKIDLLVCDICYFNSIEVMYEFGKKEAPAVKNVLTYFLTGPIAGLPLNRIIHTVQTNCFADLKNQIVNLTQILQNPGHLVAFEINSTKLAYLKNLYNNLAERYLETNSVLNLTALLYHSNPTDHWLSTFVSEIKSHTLSLVISRPPNLVTNINLLFVANSPTPHQDKLALYSKLAFTQNNAWLNLLNKTKDYSPPKTNYNHELIPTKLAFDEVLTYISIMNPTLSNDQKKVILRNLINYKQWL